MKENQSQYVAERRVHHDEPIDCPFCGVTWESAYASGEHAVMPHPGFIICKCLGPNPVNIQEELLKRREYGKKDLRSDIRQCFWEDTVGRFNRDQYKGESKDKEREKTVVEVRHEQDQVGFPDEEQREIERLERQSVPIQCKVPRFVRSLLDREVESQPGVDLSSLMRWIANVNIGQLERVPRIPYGTVRKPLRFYLSPGSARLWKQYRSRFGCSDPDLITALVAHHYKKDVTR